MNGAHIIEKTDCNDIAVFKLDNLGDFILCQPFFQQLRKAFLDARITLFVNANVEPATGLCPYFNSVVSIEPHTTGSPQGQAYAAEVEKRYGGRFDLALVPRAVPDIQNAGVLAAATGAPTRLGFDFEGADASGLYTHTLPEPPQGEHQVLSNLSLLTPLGIDVEPIKPRVTRSHFWAAAAETRLVHLLECPDDGYFLVGFGGTHIAKIWDMGRYLTLCRALKQDTGLTPLFVGSPKDLPFIQSHMASVEELGGKILIDEPNLSVVGEIAAQARFYVGNDSGLKHLAAAVGTPTVEIAWLPEDWPLDSPMFGRDTATYFKSCADVAFTVFPDASVTLDDILKGDAVLTVPVEAVRARCLDVIGG